MFYWFIKNWYLMLVGGCVMSQGSRIGIDLNRDVLCSVIILPTCFHLLMLRLQEVLVFVLDGLRLVSGGVERLGPWRLL